MRMTMSRAALSVRAFAFYLFLLAGILIVIPNEFLSLFGLVTTDEVWIRVVGMLTAILGYYYFEASRHELTALIRATVYGRFAILAGFTCLVVLDMAPAVLLLFGVVDAVAALWTARSLSADASA